jgi:hypothetical protein
MITCSGVRVPSGNVWWPWIGLNRIWLSDRTWLLANRDGHQGRPFPSAFVLQRRPCIRCGVAVEYYEGWHETSEKLVHGGHMPTRDIYHPVVARALEKDGWRITHDPYRISVGLRNLFVDLGAEKIIAAERQGKRIAVEVKSFEGASEVRDLEEALGQYLLYLPFLRMQEPERLLYRAIPRDVYQNVLEEPIGLGIRAEYALRLLVFDADNQEINQWIPKP